MLLLLGHIVYGKRLDARYAELRERLQAGGRETMVSLFGLVSGCLLVWSVLEYIARFVMRPSWNSDVTAFRHWLPD